MSPGRLVAAVFVIGFVCGTFVDVGPFWVPILATGLGAVACRWMLEASAR